MEATSRNVKFTFFDNRTYEYIRGFERKLGQAQKYSGNPVLTPELPNEFKRAHYYGTALYDEDEQLYKTWYSSHFYGAAIGESDPKAYSYLNYAYSSDGIHFIKPQLDVVPGTNIVLDNEERTHGPSVILDSEEPNPKQRFKLAMSPYTKHCSIFIYASPDGIHWKPMFDKPVLEVESDCHTGFYRDPASGAYRLSFRMRCPDRRVWVAESQDLLHWTKPVLALEPDQIDSCFTQFYGMQMTPYGPLTIGLISMYDTYDFITDPNFNKMAGTMDVQLAYSRDGFGWHRCKQGEKVISLGVEGEWDSTCIMPSSTIIYRPDAMKLYYSAVPFDHSGFSRIPYDEIDKECIGLAELRPDAFVYLQADQDECELLTRPFAIEHGDLYLNAAAASGVVKVEICDTEGRALKGFSFDDHIPFTGDSTAARVEWKGNPDISSFTHQVIRLKLRASNAKVYSIFFPHGEDIKAYWRFKEVSCLNPLKYDIS
ncbi:hypothetical protein [Paenibacillus cremeus]|uniref:Glycosyl hydrolase family 32 N-terminal domain-containing protein n=1 Tax=Paenibacillus cremeus TaxID=2163881 RepID=A0A559K7C9_9BACL|nr:hypothetical protein [Paenibacillus cremeus]TVY08040.1 hypothetical protein FPZ49_20790 [Paenibacillus cremeus]